MKCLFCQFAAKKMATNLVYEDADMIVFHNINPQAPVHLLICPKKHIESVNDLREKDSQVVSRIIFQAKNLAKRYNLKDIGYRLVINTGKSAGQEIRHLHIHLVSGKQLGAIA